MSVGFGFSVGDFIAALKVVSEVIDALRDSGNASIECRQLLRYLYDLELALTQVRKLETDDIQQDQLNALKQAALQCRHTIDEFMTKIRKYQPHLCSGVSSSSLGLKQSWYKVRWALCRKEDVEKFRADVTGHTEAINLLMNAIQIQRMTLESRDQKLRYFNMKGLVQDCYNKAMQKLSVVTDLVATSISHSKKLLEVAVQTAQMDCKIFNAVLDIQDLLRNQIPAQVLRAQPVYFIDAFGVPAPFHLEFIRSKDALLAVLKSNMKDNALSLQRLNKGQFAISDIATKHDVDLDLPWHMCFKPGQKVDMSMIMTEREVPASVCPGCRAPCAEDADLDIECSSCGLTFRRLTELNDPQDVDNEEEMSAHRQEHTESMRDYESDLTTSFQEQSRKRKRKNDTAQELAMYRKVRLRLQQEIDRQDKPEMAAASAALKSHAMHSELSSATESEAESPPSVVSGAPLDTSLDDDNAPPFASQSWLPSEQHLRDPENYREDLRHTLRTQLDLIQKQQELLEREQLSESQHENYTSDSQLLRNEIITNHRRIISNQKLIQEKEKLETRYSKEHSGGESEQRGLGTRRSTRTRRRKRNATKGHRGEQTNTRSTESRDGSEDEFNRFVRAYTSPPLRLPAPPKMKLTAMMIPGLD